MLILTITISMLCFLNPALNAFFLLTLCFPGTFCVVHYMKEHNDKKVTRLGLRAIAYLSVASIFWISDKMFCGFWRRLGLPVFHGFWHILVSFFANDAISFCAFVDAKAFHAHQRPEIRYWPYNFGISYVHVKPVKSKA